MEGVEHQNAEINGNADHDGDRDDDFNQVTGFVEYETHVTEHEQSDDESQHTDTEVLYIDNYYDNDANSKSNDEKTSKDVRNKDRARGSSTTRSKVRTKSWSGCQ